jgi:hypothetical protein
MSVRFTTPARVRVKTGASARGIIGGIALAVCVLSARPMVVPNGSWTSRPSSCASTLT